MGIKLGTIIFFILAIFLVKISLESSFDTSKKPLSDRTPASIDAGYDIEMNGNYQPKKEKKSKP